jgi:hypothetical protein
MPFPTVESRKPVWRMPNMLPFGDRQDDAYPAIKKIEDGLPTLTMPTLLLIYLADKVRVLPEVPQDLNEVAFDPQTSGGLLMAVAAREAEELVRNLLSEGVLAAAVIGDAVPHAEAWVELV